VGFPAGTMFRVFGFSQSTRRVLEDQASASLTASAQSEKELDQERANKADLFSWPTFIARTPSFLQRPSLSISQSTITPDEKDGEIPLGENVEALHQELSAKEQELGELKAGKARVSELAYCAAADSHAKDKVGGG
jgi:hypothetical protein